MPATYYIHIGLLLYTNNLSSHCHNLLSCLLLMSPTASSHSLVDSRSRKVQAFISTHLDYCNSVLYSIADHLLWHLQSMQNAAGWLVSGAWRRHHILPILRELHWRRRVEYRLAVLMYKSLNSLTPLYLADDCQLIADVGRRCLCFIDTHSVVHTV